MYQGLKEIEQGDITGEYMVLEFAEAAKLYVPLTRLDLIQKYRSGEGVRPRAEPAGRAAVGQDQGAREEGHERHGGRAAQALCRAQSRRRATLFRTDTQWQHEFEDAFEFNETDDQLTAIADIKRDMESTLPMDRLLCGDVGYGKTEVAMRAAFKAVQDGKQVAVLAPTTVLAFQHFETFKRRFCRFPDHASRCSAASATPKQQKEIVERSRAGQGRHRHRHAPRCFRRTSSSRTSAW